MYFGSFVSIFLFFKRFSVTTRRSLTFYPLAYASSSVIFAWILYSSIPTRCLVYDEPDCHSMFVLCGLYQPLFGFVPCLRSLGRGESATCPSPDVLCNLTCCQSVALCPCFCVLGICQRASSLFYSIVCSRNTIYHFAMTAMAIVRPSFLTDTCPHYVPRLLQLSSHPWCYLFRRSNHT